MQPEKKALVKLIPYLESWKNEENAYLGYVVHRPNLKRMVKIHDDAFSQAPMVDAYLTLYKKTRREKFLQRCIEAANLLVKRFNFKEGKYLYAGFEQESNSLVHISIANSSLLSLASFLEDEELQKKRIHIYRKIAEKSINRCIQTLWKQNIGACQSAERDPYSPKNPRYITNMNSCLVESLVRLYYARKKETYREKAIELADWILSQQKNHGGIAYSYANPRNFVSLYTALALRGLDDVYRLTNELKYKRAMKKAAEHLMDLIDDNTGLPKHRVFHGRIESYPQFVAGSGIILQALFDTMKITGKKYNIKKIIRSVISRQLPHGGIQNFVGYHPTGNKQEKEESLVWEGFVPVPGWNAHMFKFLAHYLELKKGLSSIPDDFPPVFYNNKNFSFFEDRKKLFIMGRNPTKSIGISFYLKGKKYGLSLNPNYSLFKSFLNRIKGL